MPRGGGRGDQGARDAEASLEQTPVHRCFSSGSRLLRVQHFSLLRRPLEARTCFAQSPNP